MRRPRTRALLLALALTTATAAGCAPQDGDAAAGVRVELPTPHSSIAEGVGAADPAVVAAAGLQPCPTGDPGAAPVAGGLPDLTLPCIGAGPDVRLSSLRGTPMVVNVWAGWCEPCRDELPVLAEVAAQAGEGVQFLGVNVLETRPDDAVRLLVDTGATYPSVRDDDGSTRAPLRWVAPPMTVLVRADGSVAYRRPGELESSDQLRGLIREHLGVDLA